VQAAGAAEGLGMCSMIRRAGGWSGATAGCQNAFVGPLAVRGAARRCSPVEGRSAADLRRDGIFALAVVTGHGAYEANPPDDRRLVAGESLVVSGSSSILKPLRERVEPGLDVA
jgi:hypothetical protein